MCSTSLCACFFFIIKCPRLDSLKNQIKSVSTYIMIAPLKTDATAVILETLFIVPHVTEQ